MNTMQYGRNSVQVSKRWLAVLLACVLALAAAFAWSTHETLAYAAAVGQKNKQACDDCDRVVKETPPEGYTGVASTQVGNKYSVYSGGNSYSKANKLELDTDTTDFANPLPYGDVYVDANKLNWDNPEGFIIDIKDDRFQWVSIGDTPLKDAKGNTSTNDPMGVDGAGPLVYTGNSPFRGICYVGPLKSYHDDIKAAASGSGFTNDITPQGGAEYLYRITYLNAVTLPDGTKGNLVLTMKKVQIETSVTVDADHLYTPAGANYSYANAFMKVQGENQLSNDTAYNVTDANGNRVNQQETQIMTAAEAAAIRAAINKKYPNLIPEDWEQAKSIRNATGDILDLDIEVTDVEGNAVNGTISYAAHDMDFESAQNTWGRPVGSEYAEAMTIVSGSQSYALVPNYNHLNATTRDTGWLPVGPGQSQLDRALKIEKTSGATGSHADGIRFASPFLLNYRDANGKFDDVIFSNTAVTTFQGDGSAANKYELVNKNGGNSINSLSKKQLYAKLKAKGHTVSRWQDVTAEMAWATLGNYSWKTYRNDDDASFDSGFAVLLDSRKSQIQWSGSRVMGANVNTTLFDPTLFTYIEQTHGTGGGIYFETYDITDECKVTRREGVSTMGRGVEATVTAVPEDGYRVKTLMVGGEGLSNPKTYDVSKLPFLDDGTGHFYYFDSANDLRIEDNQDGTYDVCFLEIQDPRHVHVDFTADFHFYKVWKGEKDPTTLNMTATPYAFVFRDVTIEGTKYTISDKGNKFTDPSGNAYTLENNAFSVGEPPNMTTYYLEGNSLVTYTVDQATGKRTKDKEYPIRLDYVQNGDPVEFTVTKADADKASETHVTKGEEDGYTTWEITYPAEGYTTASGEVWPALAIESTPPAHNINHVERNYWFVTEEAPGWSLAYYDNSKAEAPGKIDAATVREEVYKEGDSGDLTAWAHASTKDYAQAEAVIRSAADNDHAYMSVFNSDDGGYSWGGKIVNVPAVVVNAEKTWKDFSNAYKTRQDVWFHIDAQLEGEPKIEDFLPPQKLAGTATDGKDNADGDKNSKFTLTWGNKKAYGDGYLKDYKKIDYSKVKVVGKAADIPRTDSEGNPLYYQQDEKDSHKYLPMKVGGFDDDGKPVYVSDPDGVTYYVNELEDKNGADKKYTFTIRETDAAGNELDKADPTKYLYGYKSDVGKVAKDGEQATLDGVKVDSYTGKVKNTLETVDFTVKKVWVDGNNADSKRPADGAVTYLVKKKSGDSEATSLESLPVKESATQGTADVTPDYKNGKITVKTDNGDTVKFSKLPKYDTTGKEIVYSVEETAIAGYRTEITGDMSAGYTVTNTQKTEVYVEKEWDDANNQDGVRPTAVEFELLKGGTATGTTVELSESTVWKGKFADLDKYDGNTEIVYSIQEVPFDAPNTDIEYTASATTGTGTKDDPFKITNSRTPETIEIRATKVWDDETDNPGNKHDIRFDAVFALYGDSQLVTKLGDGQSNPATVATVEPLHTDVMTATWTVDKYRNGGVEIVYNVTEDKPVTSPYEARITGDAQTGFTVTNVYPPVKEEITVTRTITYTYLTEDGQTASATVTQTVTLKRTPKSIDKDNAVVEWTDWEIVSGKQDEVTSPSINGWETDEPVVPEWVVEFDSNGNPMNAYENVIYTPLPPVGEPDETWGAPGQQQTGAPTFTTSTPTTPNGGENIIVDYVLLDAEGNPATTVEVPEGTYVLNDDGTITFTPNDPTFVGDPTPVNVRGTDSNGKSAETYYQPHIVDNTKTVKRTITYEYEDGTPVTDDKGNPLTKEQTVTFTGGIVDPDTGEVTFPDDAQDTMPQVDSDEIAGYTPDRPNVPAVTVKPTDDDIFERVVYKKNASPSYNINYDPNGGTGSMADDNYSAGDPTMKDKKNTFTRKGYHYVGFLGFLTNPETGKETPIVDENGDPIIFTDVDDMKKYFEGMPDGTSIRLQAQWEPDKYTIKYDANGGSGTMDPQYIGGDAGTAVSKTNEFTREGYTFKGFKAQLPDGSFLTDENGNELIFTSAKEFFDYLAEFGDGAEITLIAQWEPVAGPNKTASPTKGSPEKATAKTADGAPLLPIALFALLGLVGAGVSLRLGKHGA